MRHDSGDLSESEAPTELPTVWAWKREFYQGGPRTYGAALLIVGLVLLTGWLRSRLGTDDLLLEAMHNDRQGECFHLRSSDNAIRLMHVSWSTTSLCRDQVVAVPYAVLVLPISLLSAFLLLRKPPPRCTSRVAAGDPDNQPRCVARP